MIKNVVFHNPIAFHHVVKEYSDPLRFVRQETGNRVIIVEGEPIDFVVDRSNEIQAAILYDESWATDRKFLQIIEDLVRDTNNQITAFEDDGTEKVFDTESLREYLLTTMAAHS